MEKTAPTQRVDGTGLSESPSAFSHDSDAAIARVETIGVLGLGYVGVPLLMAIADSETKAIGFDVDENRVRMLDAGQSYLKTISDETIGNYAKNAFFNTTTDLTRIQECDAVLICVPTPLNANREPDLSFVQIATTAIGKNLQKGQLIVLESTTYPGTTEELVAGILEAESGLSCGEDFYLAYSPEREDPGNLDFSTSTIPKVVGGVDPRSTQLATQVYERFIKQVVPVSSARVAEAAKLFENIFRCVNVGLVNELKMVLDPMGIDMWEVVEAAKTKPFGFMPFYPGPGWGGHCIPVDPFYLTWKAREYGKTSSFIEHAGDINHRMRDYIVEKTALALDTVHGRGLRDARVLIVGVAYKANVDDWRESPAMPIIRAFQGRKCRVSYHDPFIAEFSDHGIETMSSVPLTSETIKDFDVAVVCANHTGIDWDLLVSNCEVIVDTRNATRHVTANRDRIFIA
ncbi:MAG: nucleotide sugar dehydrogenase [Pseudomonadota bacterium]